MASEPLSAAFAVVLALEENLVLPQTGHKHLWSAAVEEKLPLSAELPSASWTPMRR